MDRHAEFLHLDDPAELAEVARELPATDGHRRLETVLTLDGVHCAACVIAIEAALRDATERVSVSAATRRARIVFRPDSQPLSGLMARIARLGYGPRPVSRRALASAEAAGRRSALWRMLVAVLCMMQVMMYAVPRYFAGPGDMEPDLVRLLMWAEWMLTVPVLVFASWPFLRGAWRDLLGRRVGMDVPVALGIVVMFVASSIAAIDGGEVWFDSITMFVAFLLVGRWLEAAARERALAGVGDLLARLPETVERLAADGGTEVVTLRSLQAGDRVRVSVGQSVPADGIVEAGASHTDESLLTGESTPIAKRAGDPLAAGSLNLSGPLTIRLVRAPGASRLAEIVELIESASDSKPRLAQIVDRLAGPFLTVVLLLAAAAYVAWQWIDPSRALWVAASVLIVTCPCALSLATPVALLAASGTLARGGLLVRTTQAIETLARADAFVFDKTGTLTLDRLSLTDVHPLPPATPDGLPREPPIDPARAVLIAAALEAGSLHPAATALRRAAATDARLPEVADVVEHGGGGVAARVLLDGQWHDARVGSARFTGAGDARSGVHLAIDGRAVAHFDLAETLRPDAAETLHGLMREGLDVSLLSGDDTARVSRIAALLGVRTWRAHASPEDKLAHIEALQDRGRRVVMVGDGINDAPVLARAHLSVSFAGAAPLAQHHADILVLGDRLSALVQSRTLARRAMRIVKQNLTFSASYNALCIPLALVGLMPPWIAGAGMAASSVVVVLNALRLSKTSPRPASPPLPASAGSAAPGPV